MIHPRKKREIIRQIKKNTLTALLVVSIIFLSKSVYGVYKKEYIAKERRDEALVELNELEERKLFLEGKINNLSTEKGVEKEIRRKFDVAREGEEIVIIVDENKKDEYEGGNDVNILKRLYQWIF